MPPQAVSQLPQGCSCEPSVPQACKPLVMVHMPLLLLLTMMVMMQLMLMMMMMTC